MCFSFFVCRFCGSSTLTCPSGQGFTPPRPMLLVRSVCSVKEQNRFLCGHAPSGSDDNMAYLNPARLVAVIEWHKAGGPDRGKRGAREELRITPSYSGTVDLLSLPYLSLWKRVRAYPWPRHSEKHPSYTLETGQASLPTSTRLYHFLLSAFCSPLALGSPPETFFCVARSNT